MAASLLITKKHHKRLNNPFPSTPKSLPLIEGNLHSSLPSQSPAVTYPLGNDFHLLWDSTNNGGGGGNLSISHNSQPGRSIWSTVPGKSFVSAALAETEVEESRGSFAIKDRNVHLICDHQTVEDVRSIDNWCRLEGKDGEFLSGYRGIDDLREILRDDGSGDRRSPAVVLVTGWIFNVRRSQQSAAVFAKYRVVFYQKNDHQVGFRVKLGKPDYHTTKPSAAAAAATTTTTTTTKGHPSRYRFRGGGIQRVRSYLSHLVTRSRGFVAVSSVDEDNGSSRGTVAGGKGEAATKTAAEFNRICLTYSSDEDERFFGFGEQFSRMDFKGKRVPILVQEQGIGRGDQPITLAANLISYRAGGDWSTTYAPSPFYMTSKMRSLYLQGYNYSIFDLTRKDRVQIQVHGNTIHGAILHGNSPADIIEAFTETIGRPPELPKWIISGAVVGMQGGTNAVRHMQEVLRAYDVPVSAFWLQDWVGQRETMIGSQLWWNWEVDTTRYEGWKQLLRDLSSQHIKVMTYCNPCLAPTDDKPNRRRDLYEEAKELDILVKDKNGDPYMVPNTAFNVGMLDLTHPDTGAWFKEILLAMVDDGVRGWMADFGEGLPVDAVLYSGEDPISAHNRYPELWAQINREFVEEWKCSQQGEEKEDPEDALVFFMRAGFRDSPKWAMLFWEGDQMVSWQTNDGIKSAVVGLLSSGLSGYALNHSDIGGYCAVSVPLIKYKRSQELLLRWMELSAFTTVFRTHDGNKPSCNRQFYSNHQTLSHFARLAKVYKAWEFYRIQLVKEAAQKGLPVCRHLFLHYPEDDTVHELTYQQFLVGTEFLVAPVLDSGKREVDVYFPLGESCSWHHVWTGVLYREQGCEVRIEAPIGYPAIFVKDGSVVGEIFVKNLRQLNVM